MAITTLYTAIGPDGSPISLVKENDNLCIRYKHPNVLITTFENYSEKQLAFLACEELKNKNKPNVLIGGLGFGHTLREALILLPLSSQIIVCELVPEIIIWNKNPDLNLAYDIMDDSRIQIVLDDIINFLSLNRAFNFDAIMLDVDNGPNELTIESNRFLYTSDGLKLLHDSLEPFGKLCIWSVDNDASFLECLVSCGFQAKIIEVTDPNTLTTHYIYYATKPHKLK